MDLNDPFVIFNQELIYLFVSQNTIYYRPVRSDKKQIFKFIEFSPVAMKDGTIIYPYYESKIRYLATLPMDAPLKIGKYNEYFPKERTLSQAEGPIERLRKREMHEYADRLESGQDSYTRMPIVLGTEYTLDIPNRRMHGKLGDYAA